MNFDWSKFLNWTVRIGCRRRRRVAGNWDLEREREREDEREACVG